MWVSVFDETSGRVLLPRVRYCSTFFSRWRGLTWRHHLEPNEGLLLVGTRESRLDSAIHMFFVFCPIAVVWINSQATVVDATVARPFRPLYMPSAPARDVLEGPVGLLDQVCVGDRIRYSASRP
jgi:uncharacterized membrane protein (UPF0127 family)